MNEYKISFFVFVIFALLAGIAGSFCLYPMAMALGIISFMGLVLGPIIFSK